MTYGEVMRLKPKNQTFIKFYPPSPKTPSLDGDEGAFSSGFGGFRPQGTAKDGFLRSSAKQSEGESKGTPRLRGGLHEK